MTLFPRAFALVLALTAWPALAQDRTDAAVQALIAQGDAAYSEAQGLHEALAALLSTEELGQTRSLEPGVAAERETLEKRIAALEAQAAGFWQEAAAMDPDAQDELLRRLRGIGASRPLD